MEAVDIFERVFEGGLGAAGYAKCFEYYPPYNYFNNDESTV